MKQLTTDYPRPGSITNPENGISNLPLLDEEERNNLLFEWHDTARAYPTETCLLWMQEAYELRADDRVLQKTSLRRAICSGEVLPLESPSSIRKPRHFN